MRAFRQCTLHDHGIATAPLQHSGHSLRHAGGGGWGGGAGGAIGPGKGLAWPFHGAAEALNNGATPLFAASAFGHASVAALLLQHRADVDKAPSQPAVFAASPRACSFLVGGERVGGLGVGMTRAEKGDV